MTDFTSAIEYIKPGLARNYETRVRCIYVNMIEKFGPRLIGIHNTSSANLFRAMISPVIDQEGGRLNGATSINEKRLARAAAAFADAMTSQWETKIRKKMGDLQDVKIAHLTHVAFVIRGTRNGHQVKIVQDVVHKVSPRGLFFCQFPALIKLDGKPISEAKYKAFFA